MIRNALNAAAAFLRTEKVFVRPLHVQMEPTTYCNLECPSCPRSAYVTRPQHMNIATFKEIVDKLKPAAVTLNGLGEVLMNPEIFAMIAYAKAQGAVINTTSNFTIATEALIDALLSSGLDLLNISVDASTAETYRIIRKKDAFQTIVEHIALTVHKKNGYTSATPEIRMCFVIQNANVHEMVPFYDLAHSLGVNRVLYQVFSSFSEASKTLVEGFDLDLLEKNLSIIAAKERMRRTPSTNSAGLRRKIAGIKMHYRGQSAAVVNRCVMPWISLYVSVEGDVRPCCSFSSVRYDMGNILNDGSALEVYNNNQYRMFRKKMRSNKPVHQICSQCLPDGLFDIVAAKIGGRTTS